MATVSFREVSKSYGDVPVIESLNLAIEDQEFMVLVGPSGCGKSTALRMIAGLEDVSSGEIAIGDRVVNEVPPKDRDIAMVFQNYALYPHMTIRENLEFGLRMRRTPRDDRDRLVSEASEMLGLAEVLERRPAQLSGGQRQRVALGRAIVRKPAVFLFDEPLSNLDAKLRGQMRSEIKKLQDRLKTTTVYVTHDQVEAMTMGSRIAVMKDGRIQQVGEPLEIYDRPRNLFVAGFIGTPPMNFLPATVAGDGAFLEGNSFRLPLARTVSGIAAGRRMIVGIRPEGLRRRAATDPAGAPSLPLTAEVVEPLGDEVIVHARIGESMVICKLGPRDSPRMGDSFDAVIDLDRLHLFDAATSERIAS
ncbi:MAG: sn-glycerol-3-phosphate ABC transporter ATP-binding protein UgpC [Acidobacteria bacterium]|nr:sn-glycerol-3-phosphate ABC transporter ATP-binding protein UgpC [Acidobacteriota bacterium]